MAQAASLVSAAASTTSCLEWITDPTTPPPPVCVSVRRMDHTACRLAQQQQCVGSGTVGRMSLVARRPRLTGSEGRGVQFQTLAHRSIMWRRGVAI